MGRGRVGRGEKRVIGVVWDEGAFGGYEGFGGGAVRGSGFGVDVCRAGEVSWVEGRRRRRGLKSWTYMGGIRGLWLLVAFWWFCDATCRWLLGARW